MLTLCSAKTQSITMYFSTRQQQRIKYSPELNTRASNISMISHNEIFHANEPQQYDNNSTVTVNLRHA